MTDEPSFPAAMIPVDARAIAALQEAVRSLQEQRKALIAAIRRRDELAEELKRDAVRRLAERGATQAQMDGYDAAFRESGEAVGTRLAALEEARARARATLR